MNMMNKTMAGAALTGVLALTAIVPAQAQNVTFSVGQRDRVITSYCDRNPRDSDCRSYHGGHWKENDYGNFYNRHRSGLDATASGLFGFTFGAILGSAIANNNSNNNNNGQGTYTQSGNFSQSHVDACFARYKSYDERTDSFLGYDGNRHLCNL